MNMRKIIAVLAAALMLCSIIPMGAISVSAATNLVSNGTFDSSTSGWGKSTNTVLDISDGTLKATHADDWAYVYTWITVEANTDYTISFKAKADKGGFAINFKNSSWGSLSSIIPKLSPSITTEWKEYELNFNTGSHSGQLLIFFSSNQYGTANQSIWLDDVSVAKYIPIGTAIYEEDFEDADMGGWSNSVTTLVSAADLPVANPNGGDYAIKMASTYYSYTNVTVAVEKNTIYKVTFSILSGSDRNPVNVRMRNSSSVDAAYYSYTPSTTAWETHSFIFNSGDNTSLYFRFQAAWETSVFYIDNLSVVTAEEPSNDGHIINGDFEAGAANWADSANTAVVEDPTGSNKGYVMSTNENANVTMFQQTAKNLKPNTYYNLSFQVYGFSTVSTNNSAFWVQFAKTITDWTMTQSPNGSAQYNAYTPRVNINTKLNAWYTVNIKFNTGDLTETVINFINYRTNGGQYYFDNIIVFEAKDPSFDGYLYNGDFECGTTANWSSVGSGFITHNAEQVHDGTFALALYTNGGWGGVGNQTIQNLVVGNEYYLSMWVRSDGAYFNGSLQDSAGTQYADLDIKPGMSEWTKHDVKFTATETTAVLNFSGPGKTEYAGYGYVDSIKIEAVCDRDGHTPGAAADCDSAQVCTVCGIELAPAAHTYDDNCDMDCNVCGEWRDAPHNLTTHVEASVPTNCKEEGYDEHWICADCGGYFMSNGMGGYYETNPAWMYYTGEHVRPEDAIVCAVVPCELCGEDTYGESCTRPDGAPECTDVACVNCGETIYGWGHNYNTGDEEVPLPLCGEGDCVYCGQHFEKLYDHENGAWAACQDGECSYGCGLKYPATENHVPEDCAAGGYCQVCWSEVAAGEHTYDHEFDADCNICGAVRSVVNPISFGGNSVSEDVSGLAFKFNVSVSGMVANGTTAVYDDAYIGEYKLIAMGAKVSNSKSTIDIPAVYLCDLEADSASFAVRIINIPEANFGDAITAVPYFVVEIGGEQVTIYGEAQVSTYNG